MQPQHSKLITASARRILKPLGLMQKGRSRIWLDDWGWSVITVEFQPSSWSRGSYLNVGNTWLWVDKDYLSFDDGSRIASFIEYRDDAQFQTATDQLAQQAADEVQRRRTQFPDISKVAEYYRARANLQSWDLLHAGVACGLSGMKDDAARFLRDLAGSKVNVDWERELVALARHYQIQVNDRDYFRSIILEVIRKARVKLKLPDTKTIDFDHAKH